MPAVRVGLPFPRRLLDRLWWHRGARQRGWSTPQAGAACASSLLEATYRGGPHLGDCTLDGASPWFHDPFCLRRGVSAQREAGSHTLTYRSPVEEAAWPLMPVLSVPAQWQPAVGRLPLKSVSCGERPGSRLQWFASSSHQTAPGGRLPHDTGRWSPPPPPVRVAVLCVFPAPCHPDQRQSKGRVATTKAQRSDSVRVFASVWRCRHYRATRMEPWVTAVPSSLLPASAQPPPWFATLASRS